MLRSKRPDRIEHEKVNGETATTRFYLSDPDYEARVEVSRSESWEFGVDDEGVAELVSTTDSVDDLAAEAELPDWLVEMLYGFGLSEIER
ncbi:hypothetical protein [Halosimplex pelagicum]|uniref:Uncharacterized protein n=1 Tax=Halosimplex pelagicum TaxID=869886 RepID=A0A7D5TUN3_9EURY|nr:hypothetical protein [Halosimplex pelagicum]QLH83412.1 hypothetical protein HZS54_18015 [Halosimplex pelagicum]